MMYALFSIVLLIVGTIIAIIGELHVQMFRRGLMSALVEQWVTGRIKGRIPRVGPITHLEILALFKGIREIAVQRTNEAYAEAGLIKLSEDEFEECVRKEEVGMVDEWYKKYRHPKYKSI